MPELIRLQGHNQFWNLLELSLPDADRRILHSLIAITVFQGWLSHERNSPEERGAHRDCAGKEGGN